jgi:uncharacterized protein
MAEPPPSYPTAISPIDLAVRTGFGLLRGWAGMAMVAGQRVPDFLIADRGPMPSAVPPLPVVPTGAAVLALHPRVVGAVSGGFWSVWAAANGTAVERGYERLVEAGNVGNVRIAAGERDGAAQGPVFADSDLHKWLEAAAWEYGRRPDPALLDRQLALTRTLAAAQCPDGYLDTPIQLRADPARYSDLGWSHEHYCAGHLIQAAVAQARATGRADLLDVAVRLADHLAGTFGPAGRPDLDGHPVVEMALVELYRQTGGRRYLDLARHFVDTRGRGHATPPGADPGYFSDRVPVRTAGTVEGHAVRAVYFGAGATDVAIETGDTELLSALRRQYAAMAATKQYVTGGLGARWDGESFGDEYELTADRAYAETCAAIGAVQWAWRLLLATGDAGYADQIELLLYNAMLPGVALSGTEYFYVNPLQQRAGARADGDRSPAHGRRGWFTCACCPPNVMRTLASLPAYLATGTADGLQIHQYATGTLAAGDGLRAEVATGYPWDGRIVVTLSRVPDREIELALRVPGWAAGAALDGEPVPAGRYARLRRRFAAGDRVTLELPMPVRLLVADDRVDAARGCVAVARGPLVYAAEQTDQPAGMAVDDVRIDPAAPFTAERTDILGGVTLLRTNGFAASDHSGPLYRPYGEPTPVRPAELTLIPYYAWANRGPAAMRVWLPVR